MASMSTPPAGGALYKLSTEMVPYPKSGVQALTSLSHSVLIAGANDGSVTLWERLPCGRAFASAHYSAEHSGSMIRAIVPIPPCALAPEGGFATGALDKVVRVFSWSAALKTATLSISLLGHSGGVDSLSVRTPPGGGATQLLSAGRDGHVRVWDLSTGDCVQTLEGHENKTNVLALADGTVATGSAGRRNDANQHVDYKVRIWTPDAAGRLVLRSTLDDHAQAVQDLDELGTGIFLTCANDGTIKIRDTSGAAFDTITVPPASDGSPMPVLRARALAEGRIAAACDDNCVRIYNAENTEVAEDEIRLPGTPWALRGFENGDIAIGCNHAGAGARGHVYIFTRDPTRFASADEATRYMTDLIPPKKEEGGGGGGGPNGAIKILGAYEHRAAFTAKDDGGYGFFKKGDAVFVCQWSASAGVWCDVGEMEADEAGAAASGDSEFDYNHDVAIDAAGGGTRSLKLCWNDGDDVQTVAKSFLVKNGIDEEQYDAVRDFILNAQLSGGAAIRERKGAAARSNDRAQYTLLPSRSYVDFFAVDWKKVRFIPAPVRSSCARAAINPRLPPPYFAPLLVSSCGRSSSSLMHLLAHLLLQKMTLPLSKVSRTFSR